MYMHSRGMRAARRSCWSQDNRGQRWTRDDLMRLQVMLNAGYRPRDIARVLNRTIDSIVAKATRENIHLPQRRSDVSGRLSRF